MTTRSDRPAHGEQAEVTVVNVPNALTVLRVLLVPVFVWAFFVNGGHDNTWRWVALGIFAAAMITDWFDGDYARRNGLVTDFGKLADPIADKALMTAALFCLTIAGDLWWWVTAIVVIREVGITVWRLFVVDHVVAASPGGKAKTMAQTLGVCLFVAPLAGWLWPLEWAVMAIAVVLTISTGVDYILKARKSAAA